MSRLWAWGNSIDEMALTDDLLPLGFTWLDKRHIIIAIDNNWEVNQWPDGIVREYYLVKSNTGLHLTLFRDVLTDNWFVQRLHD